MRRLSRLDGSIHLLRIQRASPRPRVCLACQRHAAPFSTSTTQQLRAKKAEPFTDRIRKRIWGTENPPGLENPYGDSKFDKLRKDNELESAEENSDIGQERVPPAVQKMMETYEPAATWDGLDRVGGFGNWWRDNWDPEHQFNGYMPPRRIEDAYEVTATLHRAVVEVFTLRQSGQPFGSLTGNGEDHTASVQISPSASDAIVEYGETRVKEHILQSLEESADVLASREESKAQHEEDIEIAVQPTESQEDIMADRTSEDSVEHANETTEYIDYKAQVASWDPSWLQISLDDPEIKFAVVKRIMRLSGTRISDANLHTTNTVQGLLKHLITPPKPRKLVDALTQKAELISLPNVTISDRRITPIDKERGLGRWKVIEKELERRGLPATGRS